MLNFITAEESMPKIVKEEPYYVSDGNVDGDPPVLSPVYDENLTISAQVCYTVQYVHHCF